MQALIIKETKDTPAVIFNPEDGIFEISQFSFPENSIKFYNPLLDWLNDFTINPTPKVDFNFNLEYINTSSSKQIMKLLLVLEILKDNTDLTIKWHYSEDDSDMKVIGERFKKLLTAKFVLVETQSN